MKNIFLSSFLLSLSFYSTTAQESYRSAFGLYNTSWNITGYDITTEEEYHYTDSFSVIGDTVFNGLPSKLLRRYTNGTFNGQWAEMGTTHLIREDTVSGKLWISHPTWASPHLIQDISLTETDSFYLNGVSEWSQVNSIYYDDENRKIVELDYMTGMGLPFTMIEGTGPNVGITYPYDVSLHHSECPVLLCQYKDGATSYVNDHPAHAGQCRRLTTGLSEVMGSEKVSLVVFPNPAIAGHDVTMTSTRPIGRVRVSDALGRTAMSISLDGKTEHSFSLSNPGIYLLHIDDLRPQKFIIH